MTVDISGLVVSLGVYAAGMLLFIHVQARRVETLPAEWLNQPDLQETYMHATGRRPRTFLASKDVLGWLFLLSAVFAGLSLADFDRASLLVFASVLGAYWTAVQIATNRRLVRRLVETRELPLPRRAGPVRWLLYWTPLFMVWVGFLAAACFLGRLIALALS